MPPACRKTLYVKDDDWRMSLMMGNFITLTNVDDQEFDRILRRRPARCSSPFTPLIRPCASK